MTIAPVPEEDDEALREAMTEELDAGAVAPVPCEQSSGHPMCDPLRNITLLIPFADFMQMACVPIDVMMADAWISPTPAEFKLPVAIANIRNKKAASCQTVTRERTTANAYKGYTSFQLRSLP